MSARGIYVVSGMRSRGLWGYIEGNAGRIEGRRC